MNYSLLSNNKKLLPYEIKCFANRLGDIFDFLKEHPEIRCNVILKESEIPDYFKEQMNFIIGITNGNYTVQTSNYKVLIFLLKEKYNAYLNQSVSDWESFNILKSLGVSDMIIDGQLGFQCDLLKKAKENVKLRVSPTLSANALLKFDKTETSFFIRPEDTNLYEGIIDIFDFVAENAETEEVLYQIYQRGTFDNNMNILFPTLLHDVPNLAVRPEFGKLRLNCGQKCETPERECNICLNCLKLSDLTMKILDKNE